MNADRKRVRARQQLQRIDREIDVSRSGHGADLLAVDSRADTGAIDAVRAMDVDAEPRTGHRGRRVVVNADRGAIARPEQIGRPETGIQQLDASNPDIAVR